MNFTLKQMRYIEAAGRLGSIAKAAQELSISQSSITAAIDAFEASLQYSVFVRTPAKGIQATPAGEQALLLIRNFLHQARHLQSDLKTLGGDTSGLVRIACYAAVAPAFLPAVLQNITDNFPGMSIQVMEGDQQEVVEFLDEGKVDLVFTYRNILRPNHRFVDLFHAPPYALINLDDPLSRKSSVSLFDLAGRGMIMLNRPHAREYFISLFQNVGLEAKVAHSALSAEIARTLVAGRFGYTIVNVRPVDYIANRSSYRAVPIRDIDEGPQFGIATLEQNSPPKILQSFIDSCLTLRDSHIFDRLTDWKDD